MFNTGPLRRKNQHACRVQIKSDTRDRRGGRWSGGNMQIAWSFKVEKSERKSSTSRHVPRVLNRSILSDTW
ncbi:hypothetical protein M408DRAFT_185617 [Serendipita vermifera MAFF 305830]|uniref:Uncharacterized protein n=1 Tax=Serendipita vermifera MAFF 305830 TaxID=933852 RepID=A0A0C3B7C3_SERVB|nr:hypothetical protein M408DRAFT_185617 [Serendipita vermifera MAFF 305830]